MKSRTPSEPRRALRDIIVLTVFAVSAAACSDDSQGPLAPETPVVVPVAWVNVGAEMQVIAAGVSVQLTAQALDAQGRSLSGRPVTWTSTDVTVATVSPAGVVTAIAGGSADITAGIGGVTGRIEMRVILPPELVLVLPGGSSVQPGETVQLSARGLSAEGDSLYRPATWMSENPGVATVDAAGRVTAHRAGSAVIAATMDGVVGRTVVFVPASRSGPLLTVDGALLPAGGLVRSRIADDGSVRQQQLVVTGGALWFANGRYSLTIMTDVYDGSVKVGSEVDYDAGVMLYELFTGNPIFESTQTPGLSYRGEFLYANGLPTGEVVVTRTVSGSSRTAGFRFGRPEQF